MRAALLSLISDNRNPASLANSFRKRRGLILKNFLNDIPRPLRILDVGGTQDFWVKSELVPLKQMEVTVLNLEHGDTSLPGFKSEAGDGCCMPQYADRSFDVVFSNSVIEHVGSRENQLRMAQEIVRIGRGYFVQTPARYFPVEPHFLIPFFWHLPESLRVRLATKIKLGWYPRQADPEAARRFLKNFLLLQEKDLHELFPAGKIMYEKAFGLTKSYIAYKHPA